MADFFVMGVVKSGSTSLYHYLGQHPEIVMTETNWPRFFHIDGGDPDFEKMAATYGHALLKESRYRFQLMFHKKVNRDFDKYLQQWPDSNKKLKGEVSPTYFHDPQVYKRIKSRFPDAKLITILRQPADRAFSHFVMDLPKGWVPEKYFHQAISREPIQIDNFWWGLRHYIRHSLYSANLSQLLNIFEPSQVKVLLYDDYLQNPGEFLRSIFEFLEVDQMAAVDISRQYNQGKWMRQSKDNSGKTRLSSVKPRMKNEYRTVLTKQFFTKDIISLQDIIPRDLSNWLL